MCIYCDYDKKLGQSDYLINKWQPFENANGGFDLLGVLLGKTFSISAGTGQGDPIIEDHVEFSFCPMCGEKLKDE